MPTDLHGPHNESPREVPGRLPCGDRLRNSRSATIRNRHTSARQHSSSAAVSNWPHAAQDTHTTTPLEKSSWARVPWRDRLDFSFHRGATASDHGESAVRT